MIGMKIIDDNPYRVFGVYSNSPLRERIANENKITAFLNVGKAVTFDLDLAGTLKSVKRSEQVVATAKANLTRPIDQMKFAQFWFINQGQADENAFKYLFAGEMSAAVDEWSLIDTISSLQNRIVCALIKKDYATACSCAEKLYLNYSDKFVEEVVGDVLQGNDLAASFLDSIISEIGANKLLPHIKNNIWKQHVKAAAATPIINDIQSAINIAKESSGKGPGTRYQAGTRLMADSKTLLAKLKKVISQDDVQYEMIADKIANEILQCGIDYYNSSSAGNKAQKALDFLKYAKTVAVGTMMQQRCNDNINTLEQIIKELPSAIIMHEVKSIIDLIDDFNAGRMKPRTDDDFPTFGNFVRRIQNIEDIKYFSDPSIEIATLLVKARPLIISMKEKVSLDDQYLVGVSTKLADEILNRIIGSINSAQKQIESQVKSIKQLQDSPNPNPYNPYNNTLVRIMQAKSTYDRMVKELGELLKKSWNVISELELLPISNEFKAERINPNKKTLSSMGGQLNVTLKSNIDKTLYYTDDDIYSLCKKYSDYVSYIKKHPRGKHVQEAQDKIKSIEKKDFDKCSTVGEYKSFIKKYPESSLVKKAKAMIVEIEFDNCVGHRDYLEFIKKHPKSKLCEDAKAKIKEIESRAFKSCSKYKDYLSFKKNYPTSELVAEANKRIEKIKREIYSKVKSCQTVQDCIDIYLEYGSDPESIIDKKAYWLCHKKSDYSQYVNYFTYYRTEALKVLSKAKRKKILILVAILIVLIVFTAIYIKYNNYETDIYDFIMRLIGAVRSVFQ